MAGTLVLLAAGAGSFEARAAELRAQTLRIETVANGLDHPWALAFLPDGRMLVTERPGRLRLIEPNVDGRPLLRPDPVPGVPPVLAQGQAGLFDLILDPAFASNGLLYLSFAHGTVSSNQLRVVRARFDGLQLLDVTPILSTQPAKAGTQHFGGRMAFLPDGTLVVGMGDGNQERTDAQRLSTHLGKLLRIRTDGQVPTDNPFVGRAGSNHKFSLKPSLGLRPVRPEIYSWGHRNPQGLVQVGGQLYAHEHGARGGDELNHIKPGANYGWPVTTGGVDYTWARITPYRTLPGISPPLLEWTPSIAPAGLAYYDAALFPAWRGSLFVAALKERSIRRVPLPNAASATPGVPGPQEILFTELGERFRDVRAGPDGALYLLTDSPAGRMLRVVPDSGGTVPGLGPGR